MSSCFKFAITILAISLCIFSSSSAQTLQDIGSNLQSAPVVTVFSAKEIITMDPKKPKADAVAVVNDKVLAVGTYAEVLDVVGQQPMQVNRIFANHVIIPGFVAQHDHPILAALTLASEILSIEDWELSSGTVKAVKDKQDFMTRLTAAEKRMKDPEDALVTWGYHPSFYGVLTRADLDKISTTRPVIAWLRSCHELVLNTAAMKKCGIIEAFVNGLAESPKKQSNLAEGHFWEQGFFAVGGKVAPLIATPERIRKGLYIVRDYLHVKGITFGNEPGGVLVKPLQDAVNAVMSSDEMPFRWSFMADGKTLCDKYKDDNQVLTEAANLHSWYQGRTSLAEKQVKLFADGAIYSQLMQVREPYLDNHQGEWMTDLDVFRRAFRIFWDAGYQIHIHVNGDAGLDRVLNTLEENLRRNPRYDHRTVIVHFAVSAKDQVDRLARLGCLVSGNPYYTRALADNYSKNGLGPDRADNLVRMGDVEKAGVSYSYHSDMPMAPADPLFLMWCGVNRITTSGRVAAPNQKVSREGALKAVTIDAAYSLQVEDKMGSITPGKLANFTILGENPLAVDGLKIKDIPVWGTVVEGRVQPAGVKKYVSKTSGFKEQTHEEVDMARLAMDQLLMILSRHEMH
jgi:predicted amidohydrolase YtcJ